MKLTMEKQCIADRWQQSLDSTSTAACSDPCCYLDKNWSSVTHNTE